MNEASTSDASTGEGSTGGASVGEGSTGAVSASQANASELSDPETNEADTTDDRTPARRAPEVLEQWLAADGRALLIRPLLSDDIGRQLRFLATLSSDSRYERLFSHRSSLRPGELRQLVRFDVRREVALLAAVGGGAAAAGNEENIGVARLHNTGAGSCEFAIVVGDAWQGSGVGRRLLARLLEVARDGGVTQVTGTTRSSNEAMKRLARELGFALSPEPQDGSLTRLARVL